MSAAQGRLEGVGRRRKVRGLRFTGDIGSPCRVNRNPVPLLRVDACAYRPPKIRGVNEGAARRVELGHEGIPTARKRRLECVEDREVCRLGRTRYVCVLGGVKSNRKAFVNAAPAQVR